MGKVTKALNKSGSQGESPPPGNREAGWNHEKTSSAIDALRAQDRGLLENLGPNGGTNLRENWDERLISSTRNMTGVAEGIRKVRTMVLYESGDPIKSLMVLSSDPQEGKSFVCSNIAISIAKSVEHQALLVDCDLRRPSLHTLFGVKAEHGLAEFLNKSHNGEHLIHETGLPKLFLIPAGKPPDNPAELLSSARMAGLMDELTARNRERIVVLDTPPFYAASETILLSQLVDKVILVVRWGKPGREQVRKMVETIGRQKILGVVFNAFEMNFLDRKIQGVGYHNYYSEYY